MDVQRMEQIDGVRFSWNAWPPTKSDANKLVVPVACTYTPLHPRPDLPIVPYEPVACRCRAVLSPYSQVDLQARFWTCPFCMQRNPLPPHYKDISAEQLPVELLQGSTTMEYTLARPAPSPPIFVFCVDTCLEEEDLKALKEALIVSLSLLPPQALVGLVTFGTMVSVHELGFEEMPKAYVFRGNKEYTTPQLQEMLGLTPQAQAQAQAQKNFAQAARFVLPVGKVEFALSSIFEQLQRDPWPVDSDKRPQRATGAACSIAVSLMESLFPNHGARLLMFLGGAGTVGAGAVVGLPLKESIRSHHEIAEDQAKYFKKASKFYEGIAKRAANTGLTVDLLIGCLDQVGVAEMKSLVNWTGGNVVLSDSFATNIFKQSCQRIFLQDSNGHLLMAFNGAMEVFVSRELRVAGLIGPAISLERKGPTVAETEIGQGGTSAWKFCGLSPRTTASVFFEMAGAQGSMPAPNTVGIVQFVTMYQHASGQMRLRVTTTARSIVDPGDPNLPLMFDQEAAATMIARIAVHKAEQGMQEEGSGAEVMRWLDRLLIRLCQRFGEYRKDDPASFRLHPNFSLYPQFMFHLRRSQFLLVFNNSPDETSFYRHTLIRENVENSVTMIQPTLVSYGLDGVPQAVLLDSASIRPDVILLLDAFFQIVIFHGEHIAHWRNSGVQDNPEHAAFKQLLAAPIEAAKELLADRFPIPMYVVCDQYGSQARFLLSKLNPSTTHTTEAYGQSTAAGQAIFTDDVSLQVFIEHLKKLATASAN